MTEEDIKTNFHNEKIIKPSCCLTAAFETNKLKQTFFPFAKPYCFESVSLLIEIPLYTHYNSTTMYAH